MLGEEVEEGERRSGRTLLDLCLLPFVMDGLLQLPFVAVVKAVKVVLKLSSVHLHWV